VFSGGSKVSVDVDEEPLGTHEAFQAKSPHFGSMLGPVAEVEGRIEMNEAAKQRPQRARCWCCRALVPLERTLPVVCQEESIRVCFDCEDRTKQNSAIQVGAALRKYMKEPTP